MRLYKSTRVNLAEMIGAEQADGASQLYLKDLRLRLAQFASRFNGFIANITNSEIADWLSERARETMTHVAAGQREKAEC